MGAERAKPARLPRGVIVLGLLLYAGAFVSPVVGAVVPARLLAGQSRPLYLCYGLLIAILATGLLRRRRWAWFSTLAFVAINAYYLVSEALIGARNTVFALSILAVIGAYLLWPNVRAAYTKREM